MVKPFFCSKLHVNFGYHVRWKQNKLVYLYHNQRQEVEQVSRDSKLDQVKTSGTSRSR
jgi:hypothetical protein